VLRFDLGLRPTTFAYVYVLLFDRY
jgi:hypothetical protein